MKKIQRKSVKCEARKAQTVMRRKQIGHNRE